MKKYRPYIVGAIVGVLVAAIVPLTGIVDFAASNRLWVVTDWYLSTAAQQSITLQSAMLTPPDDLDDPAAPARAAGHYEMVCATCHGSPAGPPEVFADSIRATPPRLVERMDQWHPDARVFWTVKHGIKHTAMPAWPTQLRDDEVWDMVAFLKIVAAMPAEEYAELAGLHRDGCASCHGEHGVGGPAPRLDIQSPEYIAASLEAFRQGTRASGTMMAVARSLSDEAIADFAAHYGKSVPQTAGSEGRAAEIARRGIPERDVPACNSCHGDRGRADYPKLAGQSKAYLLTQLELFAAHGSARGGPYAPIMAEVARNLTPEEMEALADWYGR